MAEETKEQKEKKPETPDFEKRYKDVQSHNTKIELENKELRETTQKDKELFDQVSKYIDWDGLNGTKTVDSGEEDGYVDKRTLNKTIKDLQDQINKSEITQSFRVKYPDMVQYEDLVGAFLNKTDARRSPEDRIAKAVENVKALLDSERAKGRDTYESEKKEKAAKEAEASGLSEAKGPEGEKKESDGETYDEYIKNRRAEVARASAS